MQIKVNNKNIVNILICLLLCSLFLTSYISVLNTNGIISSDVNVSGISSVSGGSEYSSMTGGADVGHDNNMAAANTSTEFSIFPIKQSRWQGAKTSFNMLTIIVVAQITCLIYYLRLSDETNIQSISSIITVFLHKKDGMK